MIKEIELNLFLEDPISSLKEHKDKLITLERFLKDELKTVLHL